MNKVLDLFCGCGGLSLGAYSAGFRPILSIDIDANLTSQYKTNFPKTNLLKADLLTVSPSDISKGVSIGRLAGIVGGPPCQGFSIMGRRCKEDPRNQLLWKYFEFVSFFRPKFFLMENVPGLNDIQNKPLLERVLETVPSNYTVLQPVIMNAANFGAATFRPRLIVVGYDPNEVDRFDINHLLGDEKVSVTVRDAISDLPSPSGTNEWQKYKNAKISRYALSMRGKPPNDLGSKFAKHQHKRMLVSGFQKTNHTVNVISRFSKVSPGQRDKISKYPRLDWQSQAHVLRAGTGSDKGSYQAARPIHPEENRVISIREAARIQGFPDWFQFHKTKWHSHRMIGNSVSPVFATGLLTAISEKLMVKK